MLDVYEDRKEISRILELYQTEGMNTFDVVLWPGRTYETPVSKFGHC